MTTAIEGIFGFYVKLGNTPAIEDLGVHWRRLVIDLKARQGPSSACRSVRLMEKSPQ